jgi:hypothetical protein
MKRTTVASALAVIFASTRQTEGLVVAEDYATETRRAIHRRLRVV